VEIVRTSSFWRDLKGILDYFGEVHAEAAASDFIDAVDETIDLIEEFPDLGSCWESARPKRAGWRFQLVKGFDKYLLLYRRGEQRVTVTHVLRSSQHIDDLLG
jgi:plasmid stabilization system protein ParE